jgi:hypothetical protein
MKPYLLFPSFFRPIGIILAIAGFVFGYIYIVRDQVLIFADHGSGNFTDELGTTFEVFGLLFIGFSRQKNENEQSSRLRLEALYWAILTDSLLLFGWCILGLVDALLKFKAAYLLRNFDNYNLFVILFIFVGRFYYLLFVAKEKKKGVTLSLLPYKPYLLIVRSICIMFFIFIWATLQFSAIDDLVEKTLLGDLFILFPVCLLIWIWSKEKHETAPTVRLKAMQIAVYINYSLFLIATWTIYGFTYLEVLFVGLISTPIIFLPVFYLLLPPRKKEPIEQETEI